MSPFCIKKILGIILFKSTTNWHKM